MLTLIQHSKGLLVHSSWFTKLLFCTILCNFGVFNEINYYLILIAYLKRYQLKFWVQASNLGDIVEVTKTTAVVIGNIIRSATAPLTDPSYHDHLLSAKLWTQAFQTLETFEFFKCNFNIKILWNLFKF